MIKILIGITNNPTNNPKDVTLLEDRSSKSTTIHNITFNPIVMCNILFKTFRFFILLIVLMFYNIGIRICSRLGGTPLSSYKKVERATTL